MQSSLLRKIVLNFKNSFGWTTNRKLIILSSDDYGNIRVASKEARDKMIKSGLDLSGNIFDKFDALEDSEDLAGLYEVLTSVKDCKDRSAVLTVFSVPANPDFDKIKNSDFKQYYYELLPETLSRLRGYEETWDLWQEGINKKILSPQFHGREHLNIKLFMESLRKRHFQTLISFENRSYCGITNPLLPKIGYTAAFDFTDLRENEELEDIITDGLNVFEKVFGFRARCFCSPGRQAHSCLEKTLFKNGVEFVNASFIKKEHQGSGRYKRIINYSGKKGEFGQVYILRNCLFAPMIDSNVDWVDSCMEQISVAFSWHKPAYISSHRVNFSGHINPHVRSFGLKSLKELLKRIISKWPDVEFITTVELGELIKSSNKLN